MKPGTRVYSTDFRNFANILTHLRPMIGAIALTNPTGEVDKNHVKMLEQQMKKEKGFHSVTALNFGASMESKFLALVALTQAKTGKKKK